HRARVRVSRKHTDIHGAGLYHRIIAGGQQVQVAANDVHAGDEGPRAGDDQIAVEEVGSVIVRPRPAVEHVAVEGPDAVDEGHGAEVREAPRNRQPGRVRRDYATDGVEQANTLIGASNRY